MNSDNFNGGEDKSREEIYGAGGFMQGDPAPLPDEPSQKQKKLLLAISAATMAVCGLLSVFAPQSDPRIGLLVSVLTFLCYTVVGGLMAMAFLYMPRLAPIAPISAFLIVFGAASYAGGGADANFLGSALLCIFPAVSGIAIALSMKSGAKRTGSILASAVSCGIFVAAVLALSAFLTNGSVDISAIGKSIESVRLQTIEILTEELAEISELYKIDAALIDPAGIVNGVFNILPAMVLLAFAVIGFFSQLTLLALGRIMGIYHKFEKKDTEFTVSVVTAAIFAFSYIASIVMASGDSAALAVFDNLSLVLMPALAVRGLVIILPRREGNAVRVGCFPLVFVIFLVAFAPALAVLFLAIWGAFRTIKEAIISAKGKK